MTKTMRAIRIHQFGGPEVLQYEINVPIPKPDSNSILIQVKAVGINPVETYIREGAYARLPKLPFIPGCDFSGVVNEVGAGVTGFKVGDNVWAGGAVSGAYSEYAVSPANLVFLFTVMSPLSKELPYPLLIVQHIGHYLPRERQNQEKLFSTWCQWRCRHSSCPICLGKWDESPGNGWFSERDGK